MSEETRNFFLNTGALAHFTGTLLLIYNFYLIFDLKFVYENINNMPLLLPSVMVVMLGQIIHAHSHNIHPLCSAVETIVTFGIVITIVTIVCFVITISQFQGWNYYHKRQ